MYLIISRYNSAFECLTTTHKMPNLSFKLDPPPYHPPVMPHMYQQQRSCPPPTRFLPPPLELRRYDSLPVPYCEPPSQHHNQPSHR